MATRAYLVGRWGAVSCPSSQREALVLLTVGIAVMAATAVVCALVVFVSGGRGRPWVLAVIPLAGTVALVLYLHSSITCLILF